jgi:hypothetical protein
LGIDDSAGYVMRVWLYQPASGKLTVASPPTHKGSIEAPDDITDLAPGIWGDDGRLYIRADRPLGEDSMFAADIDGYAQVRDLPANVTETLAVNDTTSGKAVYNSELPEQDRSPGFDDESYNEQDGGAFTAWAQNRGHGSFELLAARAGDTEPRRIAGGGWELEDFQLDPTGTRLFYNGENGLVVTDPASGTTRRLRGTRGISVEVSPVGMSADGDILVYWAVNSCTNDAAEGIDPDDDTTTRRVCLAYLPPAAPAAAAPADPWVGEWAGSGEGTLSASIRRGTAKPDYLVIDLATASPSSWACRLNRRPKPSVPA